jgi:putative flippase GtrA
MGSTAGNGRSADVPHVDEADWLRARVEILPRPVRFLAVGTIGLIVDLGVFTAIPIHSSHPISTRVVSLALATLVTWRLNRALTFERTGRRQHREAMRYAAVTLTAQGTSFAIFTALVLAVLARFPQAAILAGAAAGAVVGYTGHLLFAFAPHAHAVTRAHQKDRA